MRIWHRLKTIVPLLLAITGAAECRAQMTMGYPSYGSPAFMAGGSAGPAAYQGGPPSFQSHPMISPFDNAMEQHFTSDGFWFKRVVSHMTPDDYYFNIDYISTKTRGLTGRVGDPDVATFSQQEIDDGDSNTLPDALSLNNFNPASASILPSVVGDGIQMSGGMRSRFGWGLGWDATWNSKNTRTYNARVGYEALRLRTIDSLVLEAADGEGTLPGFLSGFDERRFAEENILTVQPITDGLALTFRILGDADEILDRVLFNLHAIPMTNGGVDFDGVNQRFDLDYVLSHSVESFGAGTHFTWTPVYETDTVAVRPLLGGKYHRINEGFYFRGVDSGLDYEANLPDGVDDDDDFVVDNVAETGDTTFAEGNPSTVSLVRSYIDSTVQSTLAGPEIGIEYIIGEKDGFRVTGSTRVGALFNTEKVRLAGDNIGDTQTQDIDTDGNPILRDMFDTTSLNGELTQNAFTDGKSSTHVSPMFQQSLAAEVPIFSKIPVLRDCWQLEGAKFRAGWTYLWLGEVADPQQSIVYDSNPRLNRFLHLNVKRSSFFQNQFNLGINWEF
ncbi:MAG: hypothetical protein RIK87_01755 [Fuerstiella sp.]